MKTYYVYLLECSDGSYYIGVTNDISQRVLEHQLGYHKDSYTYSRQPVILKHYLTFANINDAIFVEKKLKKWSMVKKLAYFKKDLDTLHEKSRCQNASSHKRRSSEAETS